ncbi:hypothetical protein M8818_006038 [Zalaria obscura]|uniref:Uncharacterized protein n=1 Tax=Zalaria obscura TaxID=2024903 RepID=A0ACC3S6R5_9PEZI
MDVYWCQQVVSLINGRLRRKTARTDIQNTATSANKEYGYVLVPLAGAAGALADEECRDEERKGGSRTTSLWLKTECGLALRH